MRAFLAGMLLVAATACGGRQVNVETGPPATAAVTVRFTNNDTSPVNVYVVNPGTNTDLFLKQVAANTTEDLPVAGMAVGTEVRLKATRTDGSKTYTSDPMQLAASTTWRVP
jgi:hypothetical protein